MPQLRRRPGGHHLRQVRLSASEAYLIEDGRITAPIKGATLIGNGPEAMSQVSMVGRDLAPGSRGRGLRRGGAERAGRRRPAYPQAGSTDRGWHPVRLTRPLEPRPGAAMLFLSGAALRFTGKRVFDIFTALGLDGLGRFL